MPCTRTEPSFRCSIRLLASLLLILVAGGIAKADTAYVGSETCKDCHQQAYQSWLGSHHYQAMLPATEQSVLGAFDGRHFDYAGITSRFFRRDGRYMVETDDENGQLKEFEIAYTFGFYPLQQYLVAFPGGRYQALNIVWDSRPADAGGQRWVHLYPEGAGDSPNPVAHDDIVHWTGSFQNWNGRCAACHSTRLRKNYGGSTRGYSTTWSEINVACEACHGPAAAHVEWAGARQEAGDGATPEPPPHAGFSLSLNDRGAFAPAPAESGSTLVRTDQQRPVQQIEVCAGCHARRSEIDEDHAGKPFDDAYRLALIEPGLYFPDGQILDEVYVYGSFLQSRMYAAGVVCTNCHDPHSNALRVTGNGLCTQCHVSTTYDTEAHHHHAPGAPGAACIDCHMPARTYMVVDDRRDHSFRVPEPRLTLEHGIPNACNRCHQDRDAAWASKALDDWGVSKTVRATHAAVLAAAWEGQRAALPELLALASDQQKPAILRASAVLASGNFSLRETLQAIAQLLYDDDSMIRAAAVRTLDGMPPEQRYALLKALIADRSKSVRTAVARQLADVPPASLPAGEGRALSDLHEEYLQTLRLNSDLPEEQLNLALFYAAAGDPTAAEKAYREALKLSPVFVPALLNLADLYRANGLDAQAEPLLQKAISVAPADAAPQYAMGLLLIRQQRLDAALPYLQKASALQPANARYSYVHGVALWEAGQREQALSTLEAALAEHPDDPDLMAALASYRRQLSEEM